MGAAMVDEGMNAISLHAIHLRGHDAQEVMPAPAGIQGSHTYDCKPL